MAGRPAEHDPYLLELKSELGFFIRSHREQLGFSRAEFSERFGYKAGRVERYEKGQGDILEMEEMAEKIREFRRNQKREGKF